MKKLLIILFLLIGSNVYSQQTFTQTFVDRCTGEVKVVTATFINGSATVAFYNKIRTFTYTEFTSGVLNQWLIETYEWWNTLSPCSSATATTQTAQQTAQTATAAASTASTAASTASSAASSVPTGGTTNATSNTTNNTASTDTSGGGSTQSTDTNSSSSTESTKSESSGGSSETKSEGGGETSEGGGETESESGEAESTSEESSEESSSEESSEEGEGDGEEGGDEEEGSDDDGDGEESEEEEDVKKKKKAELLPIQLRADMMANQALLGNYDIVTSIGATQSSIFGDVSYGATAMIWSNLNQFALNTSYTKVHMEKLNISSLYHQNHTHYSTTSKVSVKDPIEMPVPKLKSITSASLGYMNNFGNGTVVLSVMEIKPMGKWGTAGVGVNMVNIFGEGKYQMSMIGYNVLYTNMVMISPRVQYAPAFIWTQSPYMGGLDLQNDLRGTQIDGMVILSNSFTLQLTRRFSVNVGATFIKSTNPLIPLIKSFSIGSKLPF